MFRGLRFPRRRPSLPGPRREPGQRAVRCPLTWGIAALLTACLGLAAVGAAPAPMDATEPELKAAFIYNFTKFIDWPAIEPEPQASFDIAVVGAPEIAAALSQVVAGKTVKSQPIVVHEIADLAGMPALASGMEILFVGRDAASSLRPWRQVLDKLPVLTVGDCDPFWSAGGAVDFLLRDNHLRFRVNLGAAESAGLKVSSQLLALATTVEREKAR